MSEVDFSEFERLASALRGWTRDAEEGRAILAALRIAPVPRGRRPDALQSLLAFRDILESRRKEPDDPKAGERLLRIADPTIAHLAALEEGLSWPWMDRNRCVIDLHERHATLGGPKAAERSRDLARSAAVFVSAPGAVGDASRAWFRVAMRLREREFWLPHAVAWSSSVEVGPNEHASVGYARNLASALTGAKGAPRLPDAEAPHRRHHLAVAVLLAVRLAKWVERDASVWLDVARRDPHDCTAVASALLEFAREADSPIRDQCRDLIAVALSGEKFRRDWNYQAWDVVRSAVESGLGVPESLQKLLLDAAPADAKRPVAAITEDLYDAGRTLRWIATLDTKILPAEDRNRWTERLKAGRLLRSTRIEAAAVFEPGEWSTRVAGVLARIEPSRWSAGLAVELASAVAEFAWLVQCPEAADLDWALVARAAGARWLDATPGTVREVAWVDLVRIALERDVLFTYAMHARELDLPAEGRRARRGFRGLGRLLRGRWQRKPARDDGVNVAPARDEGMQRRETEPSCVWRVRPTATLDAANHIVRRLVIAGSHRDEQIRVLLVALSEDAPPSDARLLVSGVENEELWQRVVDSFPLEQPDLRPMLEALARSELDGRAPPSSAGQSTLATYLRDRDRAFAEFCREAGGLDVCASKTQDVSEAVLRLLASAPSSDADREGRWTLDDGKRPASPVEMSRWSKGLDDLAARVVEAADSVLLRLGETPLTDARSELRETIRRLERHDALKVEIPMLAPRDAVEWRSALRALCTLADPLPPHSEAAIDALRDRIESWIRAAEDNHRLREPLAHRLAESIRYEDEDAAFDACVHHQGLLAEPEVRRAGLMLLNHLDLTRAAELRKQTREVPSPWSHFSPLLFGVFGAPLSTLQTDKVWTPLLHSVHERVYSPSYHVAVWSLFAICMYILWLELRRAAPRVPTATLVKRAAVPFALLLATNYLVNTLVYVAAPQDGAAAASPAFTVLLWSHLSFFFGVFLGLIAQGRRLASEG